jgi:hypothetical protein
MHYCIPVASSIDPTLIPNADNLVDAANELFATSGAPLYDVYKARWMILWSVFIAIFFAFLYIKFMDLCAL